MPCHGLIHKKPAVMQLNARSRQGQQKQASTIRHRGQRIARNESAVNRQDRLPASLVHVHVPNVRVAIFAPEVKCRNNIPKF